MLFEILDVDSSNSDVRKVVEVFSGKYEQKCKKVTELSATNVELNKANVELDKRIAQLEETISQMQTEGSDNYDKAKNVQSYNIREFKDHLRIQKPSVTRDSMRVMVMSLFLMNLVQFKKL